MFRFLALVMVGLLGFSVPVSGQSSSNLSLISGSEAAEYQDAVTLWLSGDDLPALQALSALANTDNVAAQILLARIGSDAVLHRHVTANLPRKERISLLRQPGGLSGKSWLKAASRNEPLATALLQLGRIGDNPDAVRVLLEQGEIYLALNASERLLWLGKATEVENLYNDMALIPELAAPVIKMARNRRGETAYGGSGAVPDMVLVDIAGADPNVAMEWLGVNFRSLEDRAGYKDYVLKNANTVESWTPLRLFCERNCSSTLSTCIVAGAALVHRETGQFPFKSPSQRLISSEVYWSSDRMEFDLVRRMGIEKEMYKYSVDAVTRIDQCFASAISVTQKNMLAQQE